MQSAVHWGLLNDTSAVGLQPEIHKLIRSGDSSAPCSARANPGVGGREAWEKKEVWVPQGTPGHSSFNYGNQRNGLSQCSGGQFMELWGGECFEITFSTLLSGLCGGK